MPSKDLQSAQNFAAGALPRALQGDTNQVSSVFWRAGLNPDGTPSNFHTGDPAAQAAYKAAAQQLMDAGIQPGQGTAWKGRSHNVFSQAGRALAPILKVAAPIAALAIPGLGPLAAAGLAAGGNELGNVLGGKNALKSLPGALKSGAVVGAGRFALGKVGGLGGGGGAPSAESGGSGLGGTLQGIGQGLGVIGQNGQLNPLRLAQLGLGAAGVIQGAQAQGKANQALGRAVAPVNVPMPNLSPIFADPNNPYTNQGAGPNGAQLAALRSLQSR